MTSKNNMFKGIITALITPLDNGKIDYDAALNLLKLQIENKILSIVVGGSTGEGSLLLEKEYYDLIKFCKQNSANNLNIIAGIGGQSTNSAVNRAIAAADFGADGIMCSIPAYIKPTQEGIYQHFKAIHDNCSLPIMLYSHPGRAGVDMDDNTILKLANLERVIAFKDAGSEISRATRIRAKAKSDFNLLSGDDLNFLSYIANGGVGLVSVLANIKPAIFQTMYNHCLQGNFFEAFKLQSSLQDLYQALAKETNPIGIKYAAATLGLCNNELRLPLTPLAQEYRQAIDSLLK
ncbi:MAG: 4-hydroxy-tetrahydrodipicolinate synthase [Rickettsiaceae bacterium]|nr:4-hydroxy-tetrahydrodipicolinate synthase [Rickettsiaceae bacterium]